MRPGPAPARDEAPCRRVASPRVAGRASIADDPNLPLACALARTSGQRRLRGAERAHPRSLRRGGSLARSEPIGTHRSASPRDGRPPAARRLGRTVRVSAGAGGRRARFGTRARVPAPMERVRSSTPRAKLDPPRSPRWWDSAPGLVSSDSAARGSGRADRRRTPVGARFGPGPPGPARRRPACDRSTPQSVGALPGGRAGRRSRGGPCRADIGPRRAVGCGPRRRAAAPLPALGHAAAAHSP